MVGGPKRYDDGKFARQPFCSLLSFRRRRQLSPGTSLRLGPHRVALPAHRPCRGCPGCPVTIKTAGGILVLVQVGKMQKFGVSPPSRAFRAPPPPYSSSPPHPLFPRTTWKGSPWLRRGVTCAPCVGIVASRLSSRLRYCLAGVDDRTSCVPLPVSLADVAPGACRTPPVHG